MKSKYSKKELAEIFTINNVTGRVIKEEDIKDKILEDFNKGWGKINSKNPDFNPMGEDVDMEDTDVIDDFMDLLVMLGKSDTTVDLFESFTMNALSRRNKIRKLKRLRG